MGMACNYIINAVAEINVKCDTKIASNNQVQEWPGVQRGTKRYKTALPGVGVNRGEP